MIKTKNIMKNRIFILSLVTVMVSFFCSCGNGKEKQSATDSSVLEPTETKEVVAFLNKLYEDLEKNPTEFQEHQLSPGLSKYMVKSAMEKLLVESDYEMEGDPYFYDTEFFIYGMVSGSQHGDYNYPISRDISLDEGHWYKIYTEFADNIPAPTLIKVKVEKMGEKYMITDIHINE